MRTDLLATPGYQAQNNLAPEAAIGNPAASFLDSAVPLCAASHSDVVCYSVETIWRKAECIATLADGNKVKLRDAWQFVGYSGRHPLRCLLFCNDGLHIEVQLCLHTEAQDDAAQLEVAVSVDDEHDMSLNCLRLMREMLTSCDKIQTRARIRDRSYTTVDGYQVTLPCSSAYHFAH